MKNHRRLDRTVTTIGHSVTVHLQGERWASSMGALLGDIIGLAFFGFLAVLPVTG